MNLRRRFIQSLLRELTREDLADLLEGVRLRNVQFGRNTINLNTVGLPTDVWHWTASSGTPTAKGDLGMNTTTGKPSIFTTVAVDLADTSQAGADTVLFGAGGLGTGLTQLFMFSGGALNNPTANEAQWRAPRAGVMRNLRVRTRVAGTGGGNLIFTLRKGGAATALTCTFANTANDGSNLANSVTVAAGDLISMDFTKTATITTQSVDALASLEFAAS